MTVTCTICNKTEPTQEQFERFHIPTHEHVRMMSAYEKGIEAGEYKQSARIDELTAENARLTAANDRQALIIYAKDRQIAELTRMLFALGKQDGQTIRELTEENRGLRQMLHMEAK